MAKVERRGPGRPRKNTYEIELTNEEAPPARILGIMAEEEAKRIVRGLQEETTLARAERQQKEQKWKKWRRQREARPEQETKDYPFEKAANVSVPLTLINVNNMYAYIKGTFDVRDPLCTVEPIRGKNEDDIRRAKNLTKYLDLLTESPWDLNMPKNGRTTFYETSSIGTHFVKHPWVHDVLYFKSEDPQTGIPQDKKMTLHLGPAWVNVPPEDILYREGIQDIQRAPWISHISYLLPYELENRATEGVYENVEMIKEAYVTRPPRAEASGEDRERIGIDEQPDVLYPIHETYTFWKPPEQDFYVRIVVWWEEKTGIPLMTDWNHLGIVPIEPYVLIERPYFIDGLGVCWINEGMQDEADTIHNMRINNMHFSGMRMLAVKRNSNIKARERVYPGKIWLLDDPSRDIREVAFSEIYPSSIQAELLAREYAERGMGYPQSASGFTDPQLKTRSNFSLQAFNAQNAGKFVSTLAQSVKESVSRSFMMIVYQLVRNRDLVLADERERGRLNEEELEDLRTTLNMPLEDIPRRLRFKINTTELEQTFETQRQNTLTLVQIYTMFWQNIIPLAVKAFPGKFVRKLFFKAFTGSSRLLESVFRFFGKLDTGKYVPDYESIEMLQEMADSMSADLMTARREMRNAGGERFTGSPGAGSTEAVAGNAPGRGMEGANEAVQRSDVGTF